MKSVESPRRDCGSSPAFGMLPEIKDFTLPELRKEMESIGLPAYRGEQVFRWLYARGAGSFYEMTDLPLDLRSKLSTKYSVSRLEAEEVRTSSDGTVKILFMLPDRLSIETVAIPSGNRLTLCVSAQAGCRMGCRFCASGGTGFKRNLMAWEMAAQVLSGGLIAGKKATGAVFMGMGEPFDNYDNLCKALRILNHPFGINMSARKITVSTAGITDKIREFRSFELPVNLSASLHAADDATRSRLIPLNRKHPLPELMKALSAFSKTKRKLTLEYTLVKDLNDSPAMAMKLAGIAGSLNCAVNVIALNPVPGKKFLPPPGGCVEEFMEILEKKGVRAFLRRSMGSDIFAACGQLAGKLSRPE